MKKLFSAYKAKRMQKWLKKDPYSKVFLETPIYYILGVTLIYVICFILELTRKLKVKYPSVKFKYIDDLKSLLAKIQIMRHYSIQIIELIWTEWFFHI